MDKRKGLVASIIVFAVIMVFGVVLSATDTNLGTELGLIPEKNYVVDVIDDGQSGNNVPNDDNIEVRTVVLNANQASTEMTLETRITNKKELKSKQVAIVLDTSYSMDVNSEGYNIKNLAKELVNKLATDVPNLSISVADCSAVRNNMLQVSDALGNINTREFNTINTAINNTSGGYDLSDALAYAKSTLTPSASIESYVIVFTDATDNVDLSLFSNSQMQESEKIKVFSILTGITSSAFGTPEAPVSDGKVYMLDDYIENQGKVEIANYLNKVMKNATTTIQFNEKILESATRGKFKVEIIDNSTSGTAVQNSDGTITWNINDVLKASKTWKVQYKLKLNTVVTMASDVFYQDINVIKEINTSYIPYTINTQNIVTATDIRPTIQICDAYSLKVKAVGEGTTAPVSGARFSIIGVNEEGNTILTKAGLVTDNNGMIEINTIKYKGKVNFTIIPEISNLLGYEETDPTTVLIDNQYSYEGGWLDIAYDGELDESEQNRYDNGQRYATITVPIKLQRFRITLDVFDLEDEEGKLSRVDFRLIQPKLNNIYELDALYGSTDMNGKISFESSIMSQAGTYDYILSQMNDKTGYNNFGNATIKITFDDYGKVVNNGVEVRYNSNIEGIIKSDTEVLLKIKEKCVSSDIVSMKMNVVNENNSAEKIEGAIYEIQVTKIDSTNSTNETMTYTKVTDETGTINFKAIATETGFTKIEVHEVSAPNAYILETIDKEIIINRQNGIIYQITSGGAFTKKNPENNNGIIVDLTNKKKDEQNIIKVHLTEKDDITFNLTNVPMQLINKDDRSDILGALTDSDGCANFALKDPQTIQDGTYFYEVILDEVPAGYFEPDVIGTLQVSVIDGKITEILDVTDDGNYKPIYDEHVYPNITSTEIQYVGYTDYLLTADANSTSYLQIHLTDIDSGANIEYGKYEIRMERNGAQIANAGSTGKYTDANGITSKMSIPGLDSEPVTITISQIYDATRQNGYKVDSNVYQLVVNKTEDGNIVVISKGLSDGSELPVTSSVSFASSVSGRMNIVVFNNKNALLDPGDIIFDFSVVKYDKVTDEPMQQQDLVVWSDDLLIYNPDTGNYEDLDISNGMNPMQTGVNSTNFSPGQIQLRMKPKNLPQVTDLNKDGYPVASVLLHIGEYDQNTGEAITGTDCGIRFILTYSKTSGTYKYTGYSKDVGAAILKDFLHSNSENSGEGYVISGIVDLYSNVGEAANFAIDMAKYDPLGQELPGSKYKVKIASPTGRFYTITQPVINPSDTTGSELVEFQNVYVQEGSILTFTEDEEPIGYELDRAEAAFIVKRVDTSSGLISLEPYGEGNPRITLNGGTVTSSNGVFKYVQKIKCVDLEKNNITVKINTKDRATGQNLSNNNFRIDTNSGGQVTTGLTDGNGQTSTLIGAEKKRDYVRYTIGQKIEDDTHVTRFYKRIFTDVKLDIYFDDNGNIDIDPLSATGFDLLNAQHTGYNDWWRIEGVGEREITITIYYDREDPLNVSIKTVDKFSGQTLTGQTLINTVKYSVTPTEVVGNIDGTGYADLQVGFVDPGNIVTYTLKSEIAKNYIGIQDQSFTVTYDTTTGNVLSATKTPSSTAIEVVPRLNTKYIDITVTIEPAVPFVIHNVDLYYDSDADDLNIQNAQFSIQREDYQYDAGGLYRTTDTSKLTGAEGKTVLYAGNFGTAESGENKKYVYTIRQDKAGTKGIRNTNGEIQESQEYATVEEFKVEVEYDGNNNIVGARLFEDTASTNRFIRQVSVKQPSVTGDWGYNGNNRGIVCIEVRNDVAFNINFENTDRTTDNDDLTTVRLSGATYSISSDIPTSGSGSANGIGYAGRTLFGTSAVYTITETQPAQGYQQLASAIKIRVSFDNNGYINTNASNPIEIIEGNEYVKVATLTPVSDHTQTDYRNNFGIKLKLRSTPVFRINIDNIDRKDDIAGFTTNLSGAKYKITSTFGQDMELTKTTVNTLTAVLGQTPLNDEVEYTIKELNCAQDHQTIEKDIKMTVHFNSNGIIDNVNLDTENSAYASATKITKIINTSDYLTANLLIKNNPLIRLKVNKIDELSRPLNNAEFSIEGKIKNTNEIIFSENLTTINGQAEFGLDRALDNKTIVYTLREVKNPVGYEYIESDLTLEIVYDEKGRIAKTVSGDYRVTMTPDFDWATTSAMEDYGFEVNIIDNQIKDIGINLNVYDKYDRTKRAQNAKIKAYFAKDGASYNEDTDHSATLISGIDENNDGLPDYDYGQDYKTIGQATGIRSATLVLKEIEVPNSYYDTLYKKTKENLYMTWGYYGIRSGRIELTFTDEGKVNTVNVVGDSVGSTALGKCLDGQYLLAYKDERNPYMIDIELYYYPMLEMTINAKSDTSYSRTQNQNENDLIATYNVTNRKYHDPGYSINWRNSRDENLARGLIDAGYIGTATSPRGIDPINGNTGRDSKVFNTQLNEYQENHYGLWPGEQLETTSARDIANAGRERKLYIYEPGGEISEPSSNSGSVYSTYGQLQYQQHGQQDYSPQYTSYNNHLIGAIVVTYNEKGEIEKAELMSNAGAVSRNRLENGDESQYINIQISDNKHGIIVDIQYKRTTTVEAKVVDGITRTEITDLTLYPGNGGTANTNRRYKYTTRFEQNLARGEKTWTYWGGNDANGNRKYVIGAKFNNAETYNGYDDIGNVEIEIHYDEYGFIDTNLSRVISTNSAGNPNAEITATKDKIYLTIIATRKFDIQIDAKDMFDNSATISDARFSITTNKTDIRSSSGYVGTISNVVQGTRTQVGVIHPNETVRYTISQTYTSVNHILMDDFAIDVVFEENGAISEVMTTDGTILYNRYGSGIIQVSSDSVVRVVSVDDSRPGIKPRNINDLRIEIKNYPKIMTNVILTDQFYSGEGIPNVEYTIRDSTHNVRATGDTTTDASGKINTYTGTAYPRGTVRYTFNQTATPAGYYKADSEDIVDIEYDDNGYFKNVTRIRGTSEYSWEVGGRIFTLKASNKPKDFKIGIDKDLAGVSFKVTREEVGATNGVKDEFNLITGNTGSTLQVTDTFKTRNSAIEYLYTISETQQLPGYRKIEDIQFRVRYKTDGSVDYVVPDTQYPNVQIYPAATNLQVLSNNEKVHIKVAIQNDDKYNLTIIDEAKDISGVRVEGTRYKVEVNDVELNSNEIQTNITDTNGTIVARNRSEMGTIKFRVSEVSVGEGYRANLLNSAEILIDKGIDTYSLTLNQSNFASRGYVVTDPAEIFDTTYKNGIEYTITLNTGDNTELILRIFEDTGNITMTFKNETKSMLNINKIDSEDATKRLEGAEFKITSEEVDAYGNSLLEDGEEPDIISESSTTDENGNITINLGRRPSNKRIRYIFEEVTPPETYLSIGTVSIIYSYDISGKIIAIESETPRRIAGEESWKDVNVAIKNGDIDTYSVKLVMIDSKMGSTAIGVSNTRINDIPFRISVTDENGNLIGGNPDQDIYTSRRMNSFGYLEDGVIIIDNLKAQGKIFVHVEQRNTVDGYIVGDNKTQGIVTFENVFVPRTTGRGVDAILSNLNNGGFENSYLDTNEGQAVIKVFNDPQVVLNMHKKDIDTEEAMQGVTFTITSEIDGQNRTATVATQLNVETEGTDENGNLKVPIGAPEYGKTVIYTIKEDKIADYNKLAEVKVKVTYNTKGKINDWEVLSDESYASVKESIYVVGEKTFWETPTKEELAEIKELQLQESSMNQALGQNAEITSPEVKTKDTRQLNMVIKNKQSEKIVPYTIVIRTEDELGTPVKGIDLNLHLDQGIGGTPSYPVKTTDDNGEVTFNADGSDVLEMSVEIANAQKYTFSSNLNAIYFKNPSTGEIEGTFYGDFEPRNPALANGSGIDNENHIIYLTTTATLQDSKFNLSLMKMDKGANTTIINNPSSFTITMERQDDDNVSQEQEIEENNETQVDVPDGVEKYTEEENNDLDLANEFIIGANETTNDNGLITLSEIDMPDEVGVYKYKVYEITAPEGYKAIEDAMEFTITYGYNTSGEKIIINAQSANEANLKVLNHGKKGVVLAVYDREEVPQDQYMLNIFKIDAETGEKIDGAVFKVRLADANGTYVYTESGEKSEREGQLDYCYIEQEKDYEVRLKHMRKPSVQEIKDSGSPIVTHSYVFEEVAAPEGYRTNKTPVVLKVEFEIATDEDENEYVRIYQDGTTSGDDNVLQITDIQEDQISANILNKKQTREFEVKYKLTSDVTENVIDMPVNGIKIAEIPYTISSIVPLRTGYTFDGWNTEADGSGTKFEAGGTYAIDADVTLYAQWKTAVYTVSYNGNAPIDEITEVAVGKVDNVPNSQSKGYFDELTLSTLVPKITTLGTNYRFNSWNTEPDGSGVKADETPATYYPGDAYTENASMELYAQWDYAIKYASNCVLDENGAAKSEVTNFPILTPQELAVENTKIGEDIRYREYYSVNTLEDPTIVSNIPKMEGYRFKEWNTKRDGTGESYKSGYVYRDRKTITLYAIWEFDITYDSNIPIELNEDHISVTAENIPDKQTYRLLQLNDRDLMTTDNLYKLELSDDEYPHIPEIEPYLVSTEDETRIDDYKFIGWNTQSDGSGNWYLTKSQTINGQEFEKNLVYRENIGVTLYAIWMPDDDLYLKSENYIIADEDYTHYQGNRKEYQEGDQYILGLEARIKGRNVISEGTTKEVFKNNINTNAQHLTIYKINGDELDDDEYIGTGMTVKLERGSNVLELKLIVVGDCARNQLNDPNNAQEGAGDGFLDTTDIATIKLMSGRNYTNKTTEQTLAGDIGVNNNKTDTSDIATLKVIGTKGYVDSIGDKMKGNEYYKTVNIQ